jgi:hypothetical protein
MTGESWFAIRPDLAMKIDLIMSPGALGPERAK